MFTMYPECQVTPAEIEAFKQDRQACVIGKTLAKEFGWKVGDTVPLIGALHPHPEDKAWEFHVVGIYHSDVPNFDNRTLFFQWEYFEETLKQGGVPPDVSIYSIRVLPDANVDRVIADVEDTFRDSERRIDCSTEAEFQRQFLTMFGNIPVFMAWIGGGVLVAILVACINTMLMAMREQTAEIGVMKSLGFTDGSMFTLFIVQAMFLCLVGGGLGMLLSWITQGGIASSIEYMFPGYKIKPETFAMAAGVSLVIGPLAGIVPAWRARGLRCVDALRGTD
jgi:putative ABC transport system permease protein